MGQRGNSLKRALVLTVVGACVVTACGGSSGERAASRFADDTADQLSSRLSSSPHASDAAWLIFNAIPHAMPGPIAEETVDIDPLSARGDKTDKDGARIEVRIHVEVPERQGGGFNEPSYEAGEATRCFRFTVRHSRVSKDGMSCPDGPVKALPAPTPAPEMPGGASALLTDAVRKSSPATVGGDVRAAFPQKFITVDTAMAGGKIIAAVGVPEHRDCIVAVRDGVGVHVHEGFEGAWLAPGETGCTTELITNPSL